MLEIAYTKLATAAGRPNIYYQVDTCTSQGTAARVTFHVYNQSAQTLEFAKYSFGKWQSTLPTYPGFSAPPDSTSLTHTNVVGNFTCGKDRVALGLSGISYSGD